MQTIWGLHSPASSPESLLSLEGDKLQTSPIKGTCPQGDNLHEAAELRQTMMADEKERAEHRMLVDLMRNDLTQVAKPGTVKVGRFDVEAYANVQHLVVTSREHFVRSTTVQRLSKRCFLVGPSRAARARLSALRSTTEQMPRSFWTGSIGYIDVHTGRSGLNILIRTLEAHATKGRWWASSAPVVASPSLRNLRTRWKRPVGREQRFASLQAG